MRNKILYLFPFVILFFYSFQAAAQISQKAVDEFLHDSAVSTGHAGISIYDDASGKYLFNYNAEKNFMPSSNVKLFTLYAGMKYLGDSIKGINFFETDSSVYAYATGDPTFLHPDFLSQPVIDFLSNKKKQIIVSTPPFYAKHYGTGWAWDDYSESFMAERSAMPLYGNCVYFSGTKDDIQVFPKTVAGPFHRNFWWAGLHGGEPKNIINIERQENSNDFKIELGDIKTGVIAVPFITSAVDLLVLLNDTLHNIVLAGNTLKTTKFFQNVNPVYSRPADSLFRPMMFNSDNFFAEQTLLMVSNERLGYMNDEAVIDTLLKADLKDMPTKPRWADGSGLSRYNLFSPKDLIYILAKLKNEFGWERIKRIFPAGGEGTLKNYYEVAGENIHAKTGSMSNNVSLSGYLITKKNHTLLFSVLINNFSGSGRAGRKAIEKLLTSVIESN